MSKIENLMRQAPITAEVYMLDCIKSIDKVFGEGYAKQHPELLGQMVIAASNDMLAMVIADGNEVTWVDSQTGEPWEG